MKNLYKEHLSTGLLWLLLLINIIAIGIGLSLAYDEITITQYVLSEELFIFSLPLIVLPFTYWGFIYLILLFKKPKLLDREYISLGIKRLIIVLFIIIEILATLFIIFLMGHKISISIALLYLVLIIPVIFWLSVILVLWVVDGFKSSSN